MNLKEYYDGLKMLINSKKTSIWDSLSEAQKQDVLISFEESEDSENLLSHEDIMMSLKR